MNTKERVLNELWEKFAETGEIDPRVRDVIAESWLRCRKRGADMYNNNLEKIASGKELQQLLEENEDLIKMAEPVMEYLWNVLDGTSTVISLTDSDYNILKMVGDDKTLERFKKSNFCVGACWSEELVGTNALALCIDLDKPMQTDGMEQYCKRHHRATGSGAPIHDETGEVIGSINITSDMRIYSNYSLGMVTAAAKLIEEQIVLFNANRLITHGINAMVEGMIITNGSFKIKQINNKGKAILHDEEGKLIGKDLRDIIIEGLNVERYKNHSEEIKFFIDGKMILCTGRITEMSFNKKSMGVVVIFRTIKSMNKAMNQYAGNRANFTFDDIKTCSGKMIKFIKQAKQISKEDCSVLILGESGTGKELLAQAIHSASLRSEGPFVAVNCAALPKELVESELFGYEGGAFTGAKKEGLVGKFELADGGTILLDEIGEMPLEAQGKLLRVLESHKISRIGSKEERQIDVRVIAVTNKNLKEEVEKNTFRLDLYYRINVVTFEIPRLNDREGDIRLLANFFLERRNQQTGKNKRLDEEFIRCLECFNWQGNVRQLQNVIDKSYYICSEELITCDYLSDDIKNAADQTEDKVKYGTINSMEKDLIIETILKNKCNITQSAIELGISKPTIYRKMKKYDITKEELKKLNNVTP